MKITLSSFAFVLFLMNNLALANPYENIQIDGELSDWSEKERINFPIDLPPALASEDALYAKFVTSPTPTYLFAIKTRDIVIGQNTTFWLNIDNNIKTGYKVSDMYGGAEYYVNIHTDNRPYLYKTAPQFGEFVAGPLEHSYGANGTILEFALPSSLIGMPQNGISLIGDINDDIFFPTDYSSEQLTISNTSIVLPPRTDFSKRVGIVYSKTSKSHFFDTNLPNPKAYSQLFMAVQHQSMMAGVPFDLLTEDDLTDISKLVNYDTLIFPYFAFVPTAKLDKIYKTLYQAIYHYGIGIITAGDWMTNTPDDTTIDGNAYRYMEQLLGIGRVDGEGPVKIKLSASDTSHPAMNSYEPEEIIYDYTANHWYNYFAPVNNGETTQPVTVLATQTVTGNNTGTYDAVLAIQTGARHVHFSSIEFLGDTNLLWSALQWSVYGKKLPATLKMGRYNNIFISRNDMDQSQEINEVEANNGALLNLLKEWKTEFNFVGSYYINIGNNPPEQQTNWSYSAPLYRQYIALGNEIGTHSYTHPHDTNILTPQEIEFEFNQAMNIVQQELTPTWRDKSIRGGAVPGAPEGLSTAEEIMQYLDYLSGGYSSVGAGYPSAFGYLTPDSNKVYFSPNMSFDFTLMEFGTPIWDADSEQWIPHILNAIQAEEHWANEYKNLMRHSSQPIIHWPWHDYGPTTSLTKPNPYSLSMFQNTIKRAFEDNSEFLTTIDAAQRINTFKNAKFSLTRDGNTINANVQSQKVGKFALKIDKTEGKIIQRVDNWYAYDKESLFLDQDGGNFTIHLGATTDNVTHITSLPMRATLLSVEGDGNLLSFSFEGEGKVRLALAKNSTNYNFTGADTINTIDDKTVELTFNNFGTHTLSVTESTAQSDYDIGFINGKEDACSYKTWTTIEEYNGNISYITGYDAGWESCDRSNQPINQQDYDTGFANGKEDNCNNKTWTTIEEYNGNVSYIVGYDAGWESCKEKPIDKEIYDIGFTNGKADACSYKTWTTIEEYIGNISYISGYDAGWESCDNR